MTNSSQTNPKLKLYIGPTF